MHEGHRQPDDPDSRRLRIANTLMKVGRILQTGGLSLVYDPENTRIEPPENGGEEMPNGA